MARYYGSSTYYKYLEYLSFPIPFYLFITVVFLVLGFTWYINYEPMLEDLVGKLKIFLMVFPVILVLFVHWLSIDDSPPLHLPFPEKDSVHRVGGSPFGVAIVLMLLMFMISHHSSLQEKWFPLFTRRK